MPRGWFYQNELTGARAFYEKRLADVEPLTQRVFPERTQTNVALFEKFSFSPYTFAINIFNREASPQTFARTQTSVNLALVACALERYRLTNGHYPETLTALAPEFLEKLPHDIINGEPLKYRLKPDGNFILYSVGWNEQDDGGAYPGKEIIPARGTSEFFKRYNYHPETGDWVWRYPDSKD